jgi:hypothetical protein
VHGAGSAKRHSAAELRTAHAGYIAQGPEQRHLPGDIELVPFAVDGQRNHASLLDIEESMRPARATSGSIVSDKYLIQLLVRRRARCICSTSIAAHDARAQFPRGAAIRDGGDGDFSVG